MTTEEKPTAEKILSYIDDDERPPSHEICTEYRLLANKYLHVSHDS